MPQEPETVVGCQPRSRTVFIHSRSSRLFLGSMVECDEREVSAEEVEALASAGFDIVQVDMKEETPLCSGLASLHADVLLLDASTGVPSAEPASPEP
jgi:hypothetical protein